LPAGYHLLKVVGADEDPVMQRIAAEEMALAETNTKHGTDYGELPEYYDGNGYRTAPADVVKTYKRARARLEMELAPLLKREVVSPSAPGLTLELRENANWLDLLPPPLPAGPWPVPGEP
jgi:hypothetical protein